MRSIHVVYMGGTLGCVGLPLSPLPAPTFLAQLQALLHSVLPNERLQFCAAPVIRDSTALNACDWLQLIKFLHELKHHGARHILLIHGTDTLSYAAAVLSRFLDKSLHLVITGSQVPLWDASGQGLHPHSDALKNIKFALAQLKQVNAGCYVAFAQQLIAGRASIKLHRNAWQAFADLSPSQVHVAPVHTAECHLPIDAAAIKRAESLSMVSLMLQPISNTALI